MQRKKRLLAVFLCLVVALSAMSVTAFASNWTDSSFTNLSISATSMGQTFLTGRTKEDNTASYVHITNSTNRYTLVWVFGGENPNATSYYDWEQCYMQDGDAYGYVICQRGVQYSLYSNAYSRGYTYVTLGFSSIYGLDSITGVWSPDSLGTYATPEGA